MADKDSEKNEEDQDAPGVPAPPTPVSSQTDLRLIKRELRDQQARVNKLKREEKGWPARDGQPARIGRFNPHIRAEVKLLSELSKLRWMMEKLPDPSVLKNASSPAAQELSVEMRADLASAEKVLRKLMEEGPALDADKPK